MARLIAEAEKSAAQELLSRSRAAMNAIDHYDQKTVDRLCQALAWATANERTFARLTKMSVDESGMGNADGAPQRRFKVYGILRDALRTKSVGIIEENAEKGIVKYAKPAGVIAGLLPCHESAGDDGQHGHQRGEVQGRRHLLAASRSARRPRWRLRASSARR